jgi:aminoglycoside/choline kinase family phosphotransferase
MTPRPETTPIEPASNSIRQEMVASFIKTCPEFAQAELLPLAGDASFRRYIRVKQDGRSAMLMDAPPEKEDARKYLVIAEYLLKNGYSAPAIMASDIARGFVLLEDFGDDTFTRILNRADAATKEAQERELYEAAVDLLAEWYVKRSTLVDASKFTPGLYNDRLLLREVSLFAEWYLPQVLGRDKAEELHDEYMGIWKTVIAETPLAVDTFVHRDYHADNLMWLPERSGVKRVGLLDFQDGVYGDPAYDMVSLLEDARRDVPQAIVQHAIMGYLYASKVDSNDFKTAYAVLGAQRNSKIIGIFVRLAARDNKHHYLDFLPRVWKYLENDLSHPVLQPLAQWIDKHVSKEWRGAIPIKYSARDLTQAV